MPTTKQTRAEELREDALALQEALTDLVRAYQFRDRDAICCYDVSLVQSQALERLARRGAMTLTEFAAALFLERSSASRLVDALERKGYVTRRPDEHDGRYIRIDLTKTGRALARKLEDDLVAERSTMLAELSETDRTLVLRAMRKLAGVAAAGIGTDGGCHVRR